MAARLSGPEEELLTEINITPFVDIILVVLIIFMVTATYIVSPSIKVNLPEATTGEEQEPTSLGITLAADGQLYLDGEPVTEEQLRRAVREARERDPRTVCLLAADREVRHGDFVHLVDLVRQEGIARFAIEIQPQEAPETPSAAPQEPEAP